MADETPNQPLRFEYAQPDEQQAFREFLATTERYKLPYPKTQRELANVSVETVARFQATLARADLTGFPRNWKPIRAVIESEVQLLQVGNLISVVWTISSSR